MKTKTPSKNIGLFHERCKTNPREKAFSEQWTKENEGEFRHAINFGKGLLQDLFMEEGKVIRQAGTCLHVITDDERFVVATVIQWLGSNVGMSFLEEALKKCGYRIVREQQ